MYDAVLLRETQYCKIIDSAELDITARLNDASLETIQLFQDCRLVQDADKLIHVRDVSLY